MLDILPSDLSSPFSSTLSFSFTPSSFAGSPFTEDNASQLLRVLPKVNGELTCDGTRGDGEANGDAVNDDDAGRLPNKNVLDGGGDDCGIDGLFPKENEGEGFGNDAFRFPDDNTLIVGLVATPSLELIGDEGGDEEKEEPFWKALKFGFE